MSITYNETGIKYDEYGMTYNGGTTPPPLVFTVKPIASIDIRNIKPSQKLDNAKPSIYTVNEL